MLDLEREGVTIEETFEEIKRLRNIQKALTTRNEHLRELMIETVTNSDNLVEKCSVIINKWQMNENIDTNMFHRLVTAKAQVFVDNQIIKKELEL